MNQLITWFYIVSLVSLFTSCQQDSVDKAILLEDIAVPSTAGAQPNLTKDELGNLYLSWIEELQNDTFSLQYSKLGTDGQWLPAQEIVKGNNWFINWADFPSLTTFNNGGFAAHWLQMRDTGTYDYDIYVSTSEEGNNWNEPFILHDDQLAAEHGFVSMASYGKDEIMATWLDGRNTKQTDNTIDNGHGHGHGGAMTLRTAIFNIDGQKRNKVALDNRICDCCQTDLVISNEGPIIVYRDRSQREVRDMSIVRQIDGQWTEPKTVYNDEWLINGCPVNGPSIAVKDSITVVAWYTEANEVPKVQIAISEDYGANFSTPIRIDEETPLGRVDVLIDEEEILVTWLSKKDKGSLNLTKVNMSNHEIRTHHLSHMDMSRRSGFPIIEKANDRMIVAWSEVSDEGTKVKSGLVTR